MEPKRDSNYCEGMRVVADYNVGNQRIIVLEWADKPQVAAAKQPAKPTVKITPADYRSRYARDAPPAEVARR
jgi:hypothetical protein